MAEDPDGKGGFRRRPRTMIQVCGKPPRSRNCGSSSTNLRERAKTRQVAAQAKRDEISIVIFPLSVVGSRDLRLD